MAQAKRKLTAEEPAIRRMSLRIPEELAQRIEQEAARQHRSTHAHILHVLQEYREGGPIIMPATIPFIGKKEGKNGGTTE